MIVSSSALAWCGLTGSICDAMGGIYLTYDLLGGRVGPLGFFNRAATYSLIFALGYGLPFGLCFGMVAGLGLGAILALEFWRVARHQRLYHSSPLFNLPLFGAARGVVLGVAAIRPFGWGFGLRFGALCSAGLFTVYSLRFAPTYDYNTERKPRFSRHLLIAALLRGLTVGAAGVLAGWTAHAMGGSLNFGLEIGLAAGLVSAFTGLVSPFVEWRVENLPERHLVLLGFGLIFMGLTLQSVQYVTVLLKMAGP